tara:strand:- start:1903 stop:2268 length:366 start_codon:yes stop_codon:yes gene_type:complete
MSWCESMCECGETVSYGFYGSEHEDELSEINITVLCGQCVRERDGITLMSDNGIKMYADFKNLVLENGLKPSINFSDVPENLQEILSITCDFFDKENEESYIKAAFSLLMTMPKTAIRWHV